MKKIAFFAVLLLSLSLLPGCGGADEKKRQTISDRDSDLEAAVPYKIPYDEKNGVVVIIDTAKGKIKAQLFPDKAPITVANFLKYVDDKFYDGTIFHRVMPDFMIQGGGFGPGMVKEKKTRAEIKNEASNGLSNKRGTLAMARTNVPDSATSQFFINVVDNDNKLDPASTQDHVGYAVFGQVIEGMDVVDKIRFVRTRNSGPHQNVPAFDVLINSIRRAP